MARPSSITPEQGAALLEAYQRLGSKSAAAREIGVSEDAAARYLANAPKAAAPVLAQEREVVKKAAGSLWDTRTALGDNYQRLLDLELQARALSPSDPKSLTAAVGLFREIRGHIETSLSLAKLLTDIEEVRKFQQAVIEAIGEADEPTRQRLIAKLRERRALGLAL